MAQNHPILAFFDVDHTLVDGNVGLWTSLRLIRLGILKKRRLAQAAYYSFANLFCHQDVKKIYQIAVADIAGLSLDRAYEIGTQCLTEKVMSRFFRQGLEKIDEHRRAGHRVILLTSGPYMTMHPLAKHLGIADVRAMGPTIADNRLTSTLAEPLCYSDGKLTHAEQLCREYGADLQSCYFYTDEAIDLPLLEAVGHPVAVNPRRDLKKIARARQWPILTFKEHAS